MIFQKMSKNIFFRTPSTTLNADNFKSPTVVEDVDPQRREMSF